jgi:hypothetical protein
MAGKPIWSRLLGFCFLEKGTLAFTFGGTMDKYYFLTHYEIDCLERTLDELIQMYPLVPIAQIESDMIQIQEMLMEEE